VKQGSSLQIRPVLLGRFICSWGHYFYCISQMGTYIFRFLQRLDSFICWNNNLNDLEGLITIKLNELLQW